MFFHCLWNRWVDHVLCLFNVVKPNRNVREVVFSAVSLIHHPLPFGLPQYSLPAGWLYSLVQVSGGFSGSQSCKLSTPPKAPMDQVWPHGETWSSSLWLESTMGTEGRMEWFYFCSTLQSFLSEFTVKLNWTSKGQTETRGHWTWTHRAGKSRSQRNKNLKKRGM